MISDKPETFFLERPKDVLRICEMLAPVMNRVHSVNYSQRFWTRILLSYAISIYNKKDSLALSSNNPIPLVEINGWAPASRKEVYKNYAMSALRSFEGGTNVHNLQGVVAECRSLAFGLRKEAIASLLNAVPVGVSGWFLALRLPDRNVRRRLTLEAGKFESVFDATVICQVPKLYVEHFPALLVILRRLKNCVVESIFFEHAHSKFEGILSAYLAEIFDTKLYQLQQGGFVGETTISIAPDKRALYDYLLTYGWSIDRQDVPFYAVRLEEFRAKYQKQQFSGVASSEFEVLFVYGAPENSVAIQCHYTECTTGLLLHLDRKKFPKIRLRARATSRFLRQVKYPVAFANVPKDSIDTDFGDISQLCASCDIVVQWMMPATNFLECIFVDHPILAVDTNHMPTELFGPFKAFFHEVGVFHRTPHSLISFLNGIDIELWWLNVIRRQEYSDFKLLFARSRTEFLKSDMFLETLVLSDIKPGS